MVYVSNIVYQLESLYINLEQLNNVCAAETKVLKVEIVSDILDHPVLHTL